MKLGLFGKKLGMTQVFDGEEGVATPVSLIQIYESKVLGHREAKRDGYDALVLGFGEVEEKNLLKPRVGAFKKLGVSPFRYVREVRVEDPSKFPVGTVYAASVFAKGDDVHVVGTSKGKGFQGVIKRHHKAGGPAAHGSGFHRTTGSIGQRTYPGKVFKNMKMAGRMGGDRVKVKGLQVVTIDLEKGLLLVKGAVPGSKQGLVFVESVNGQFAA